MSKHAGDENFKVKASDPMPYLAIDSASVFDRLRASKFHFLVFSNEETDYNELLEQTEKRSEWIGFQTFPLASIEELKGIRS